MNENPQNLEDLTILQLITIHTYFNNKLKQIDRYDVEIPSHLKKEYYGLCDLIVDVENSILNKVQKLRNGKTRD
jgi:hypothetical protein